MIITNKNFWALTPATFSDLQFNLALFRAVWRLDLSVMFHCNQLVNTLNVWMSIIQNFFVFYALLKFQLNLNFNELCYNLSLLLTITTLMFFYYFITFIYYEYIVIMIYHQRLYYILNETLTATYRHSQIKQICLSGIRVYA